MQFPILKQYSPVYYSVYMSSGEWDMCSISLSYVHQSVVKRSSGECGRHISSRRIKFVKMFNKFAAHFKLVLRFELL